MPAIVAHRGAHGKGRPENSLAAFLFAQELDVGAIELDVQLNEHGDVIIHHDEYQPSQPVAYPYLADLLARVNCTLFVEVKVYTSTNWVPLFARVCAMLEDFPQHFLLSFHQPGLRWAMENYPQIPRAQNVLQPEEYNAALNPSVLSIEKKALFAYTGKLPPISIACWTCNDPLDYERAEKLGVDWFMTDTPERFLT